MATMKSIAAAYRQHRASIENAAIDAVIARAQVSPEDAIAVISAIIEGLIPNVTMNY